MVENRVQSSESGLILKRIGYLNQFCSFYDKVGFLVGFLTEPDWQLSIVQWGRGLSAIIGLGSVLSVLYLKLAETVQFREILWELWTDRLAEGSQECNQGPLPGLPSHGWQRRKVTNRRRNGKEEAQQEPPHKQICRYRKQNPHLITTLDINYMRFPTFVIIVLCITWYFLNFSCTTITLFHQEFLFFVKTSWQFARLFKAASDGK